MDLYYGMISLVLVAIPFLVILDTQLDSFVFADN